MGCKCLASKTYKFLSFTKIILLYVVLVVASEGLEAMQKFICKGIVLTKDLQHFYCIQLCNTLLLLQVCFCHAVGIVCYILMKVTQNCFFYGDSERWTMNTYTNCKKSLCIIFFCLGLLW